MMTTSPSIAIQSAKKTGTFLLLALTLLLSGAALASGGGNYGGGGSDGSGPKKLNAERYSLGKHVYKSNVNCAGCIINKSKLSKNEAANLYKHVRKDSELNSSLSKKERKALKYYMRERFKL